MPTVAKTLALSVTVKSGSLDCLQLSQHEGSLTAAIAQSLPAEQPQSGRAVEGASSEDVPVAPSEAAQAAVLSPANDTAAGPAEDLRLWV